MKLSSIENRFEIIIDVVGKSDLRVVMPLFRTVDRISIELELSDYNIEWCYVTPFNFRELCGSTHMLDYEVMFAKLVMDATDLCATDLHVTVRCVNKKPEYVVQGRVGTDLIDIETFSIDGKTHSNMIKTVVDRLTNKSSTDLETSSGVVATVEDIFQDNSVELRLSISKVYGGFDCVCRIQHLDNTCRTIDELGLKNCVDVLYDISRKVTGLTLITGAKRTGKNTTALAVVNEIIKYPVKVKTFENPIEALIPAPQMDYMGDKSMLLGGIRNAKKQDLDISFINEISDSEVAFAVQDLVNSSVHVITTMHIDRLWHLPYKLFELYGNSYKNIIAQMNYVINQKMFKRLDQCCLVEKLVDDIDSDTVKETLLENNVNVYYENNGCDQCGHTDYVVVVEWLRFDDKVRSTLLSCDKPHEMERVIREYLTASGNILENEICEKIKNKQIHYKALEVVL